MAAFLMVGRLLFAFKNEKPGSPIPLDRTAQTVDISVISLYTSFCSPVVLHKSVSCKKPLDLFLL